MSFTLPFSIGPVFFRTALPCSGYYHLERGGMPLHDVVGINCEKDGDVTRDDLLMMLMIMCVI